MKKEAVDATVLIPSYNSKQTLIPCVEHFIRQSYPPDRFEVIIVLDGSTDGSREALEALSTPFPLKIIEQPNRGRAAALNRGIREAKGEILIVTDSDILVDAMFVESHVKAHRDSDVVIGPIPLAENTPANFVTDGCREWAENHEKTMLQTHGPIPATSIYGGNISMTLSLMKKIGGYREDLRRSEDHHLGEKILQAGYTVSFCPEAVASQIFNKTFYDLCRDFYVDGKSQVQLIQEFPHLKKVFKAGNYYPQTLTKRILRPLIIQRRLPGRIILAVAECALEQARKLGLRWKILLSCQGVILDSLYFQGIYDTFGNKEQFHAFIKAD